jgi:Flp pilus assembly protein TadB
MQLNEAAFLACARVWQEKYAKTNNEVTEDTSKLISAFSAYHTAHIHAGTLKEMQKEKEDKKKKSSTPRLLTRTTVVVASALDVITVLETIAVTIVGIHAVVTMTIVMTRTVVVVTTSARATRSSPASAWFAISLTGNEHFEEFDFIDSSIHINKINEPVAECTDNVQNF